MIIHKIDTFLCIINQINSPECFDVVIYIKCIIENAKRHIGYCHIWFKFIREISDLEQA